MRLIVASVIAMMGTCANAQDCTTAQGLLLAPFDGWEHFNDAAPQVTQTEANAQYNLILETDDTGAFVDSSLAETVGIRVVFDPAVIDQMKFVFQDATMAGMLETGPLGYPTMMGRLMTIVGDFQITLDGNGPGVALYYEAILRCALGAGLPPIDPDWTPPS
jgi:hypothetical protein